MTSFPAAATVLDSTVFVRRKARGEAGLSKLRLMMRVTRRLRIRGSSEGGGCAWVGAEFAQAFRFDWPRVRVGSPRERKFRLLIRLRGFYVAFWLSVSNRKGSALTIQRRAPDASLGHRDNILIRIVSHGNFTPPVRLVVDITPPPFSTRRAHVKCHCVGLRTPVAALGDHVLRTVGQT